IEWGAGGAAHWARAATSAQERSARSEKQGPRHCLEVWSCLFLYEWPKVQLATSRLAKYSRLGGSELQKCTVNRKEISFTCHQQPMNRITCSSEQRDELARLAVEHRGTSSPMRCAADWPVRSVFRTSSLPLGGPM